MKKGEKKIGKWTVKVHKMEGLYPYVRLEDFMKVCKGLEEENKNLKEEIKSRQEEVERFKTNAMQDMSEITELEEENRKLKKENEDLREEKRAMEITLDSLGYGERTY